VLKSAKILNAGGWLKTVTFFLIACPIAFFLPTNSMPLRWMRKIWG